MLIANPIYDVVFKRLMENNRVARFFVETLLGEQVTELAMLPQEYTRNKSDNQAEVKVKAKTKAKVKAKADAEVKVDAESDDSSKGEKGGLGVIRFDFVATVRSGPSDYRKVLIELQKSQRSTNLKRFRTYLGEQYNRVDTVNTKDGNEEKSLPIIAIYILGYNVIQVNSKVIKIKHIYNDMISNKEIEQKSEFIEALTHDGYYVQLPNLKGDPGNTLVEKLLSIFEQDNFVDGKTIFKEYKHSVDHGVLREILGILHYLAVDPVEKRAIQDALYDLEDEEAYQKALDTIAENVRTIAEKDQAIAEKDQELEQKDQELEQKDQDLEQNALALEAEKAQNAKNAQALEAQKNELDKYRLLLQQAGIIPNINPDYNS